MNYPEITIVTGCSKGIGLELLQQLLLNTNKLSIGIARTTPVILANNFRFIAADLSNLQNCLTLLEELKSVIDQLQNLKKITLINNAARLGNIKASWENDATILAETLFLNLTAPLLLQNFICAYAIKGIAIEVLNISSGAALKPYYGWEAYCSGKAGLLMASKVLALEMETKELPAKIWSLMPGVVDTEMQVQIRNTKVADFIDLNRFIELKEKNELLHPSRVAGFICNAIGKDTFKNGEHYDIRNFPDN